jgi:alginate O-acetyltransferase complex protein AlgI
MTTWFHDYVFKPLGGARKGRVRALVNVMAVFVLSGLWHGAAWTYVMSGVLIAVFFLVGHVTRGHRNAAWTALERSAAPLGAQAPGIVTGLRPWIARVTTFHLVCTAYLFFRANTIGDALGFARTLAVGAGGLLPGPLALNPFQLALAFAAILTLLVVSLLERRGDLDDGLLRQPRWVRWGAFYSIAGLTLMFGEFRVQEFIYFQF